MSDEIEVRQANLWEANLTGERPRGALGWIPHEEPPVEKGTDGPNEVAFDVRGRSRRAG